MKKVLALSLLVVLGGCSSMRHDNLKDINKADEMFLCHAAYEGMDLSIKDMAQIELGMRGIQWDTRSCKRHAENEEMRRSANGDMRPTFYHDEEWSKRAKQFEKNGDASPVPATKPKENDAIVIDAEFFKSLLK